MNNFRVLGHRRPLVVWYLGERGEGITAQGESWVKEVGSGSVGFHRKVLLSGKVLTISRNWLALGGAVSARTSKGHNVQNC